MGAIGITGFDDPPVLVFPYILPAGCLRGQHGCKRHMRCNKGIVLRRQKRSRAGVMQDAEEHLVVHDLGAEVSDQADTPVTDSLQKRLYLSSMGQNVTCHGAPVDGVDGHSLSGQEPAALIPHMADLRHKCPAARPLKCLSKGCKLGCRRSLLQKIHDRHCGKPFIPAPLFIDPQEDLHPGVKKFEHHLLVACIHLPVEKSILIGTAELRVFIHGAAAVGIELAELEIACLLIQKNIQAADRQKRAVGRPVQDHFLQFRRKAEQGPVILPVQVLPDHAHQDSPGLFQVSFQFCKSFFGKIFGQVAEFDRHPLIGRCSPPHLLNLLSAGGGVCLKILQNKHAGFFFDRHFHSILTLSEG